MIVHCAHCAHTWDVALRLPMSIERACIVIKGAVASGCPSCGAYGRNVICGPALAADAVGPSLDTPIVSTRTRTHRTAPHRRISTDRGE